jgi:3-phosphoshikimate 1-carboxyvinyltransferase
MNRLLKSPPSTINSSIQITGSKSESNRLLLLQALYPAIKIENLSNSDDSQVMQKALASTDDIIDIHHAGTAMRFLTAYFATQEGREVILTGSKRMTERPIKILVDALKQLGADISYTQNIGYPPLKIKGKTLSKSSVTLAADVSSQYISALLLIAPRLQKGITLNLEGKITSIPYINMTLALLNDLGVKSNFSNNCIEVAPLITMTPKSVVVESDWSSASYFYSIVAMSTVGAQIKLSSYRESSLQGDSILQTIYAQLGVKTEFNDKSISLSKISDVGIGQVLEYDLSNAPDIAQTIAVSCFGLGIACNLTGLHTLKIKETDRLEALYNELSKLGAEIEVTDNSLHLKAAARINSSCSIPTYQDHRMAMAFAPLALKTALTIEESDVVSKSFPDYWTDLEKLGFLIEKVS